MSDTHPPEWYAGQLSCACTRQNDLRGPTHMLGCPMFSTGQEAARMPMPPEHQLNLLELRHSAALQFIDSRDLRIEYDNWMAGLSLASEFVTGTYERGEVMNQPDWGSAEAKTMDGAIGQFGIELEYFDKSIARLQQRIGPILRDDVLVQVDEPKVVPNTELRKLLDRLGQLRVMLDRITDSVDL